MFLTKISIDSCMIIHYIVMPNKGEYLEFKKPARKIKSPFLTYAEFESILVPEDNVKQNPNESYANKYQKHVTCRHGNKFKSTDDKFSNPIKSYLSKDAVYNFISSLIE